jgi:hypothetical protein
MIRGGTYEIEVIIKEEPTGDPVDLTLAAGILVALYGDGSRIFGKWSLVDKSAEGYGEVFITDAINGKISVYLEATESLNALEKMAKMEVKVALPDANFQDNLQINIATNLELERVERSIFESISPV